MVSAADPERHVAVLVQAVSPSFFDAIGIGQLLRGILYAVRPADPVALAVVLGAFASITPLAAWLPARRAAAIDPLRALRAERQPGSQNNAHHSSIRRSRVRPRGPARCWVRCCIWHSTGGPVPRISRAWHYGHCLFAAVIAWAARLTRAGRQTRGLFWACGSAAVLGPLLGVGCFTAAVALRGGCVVTFPVFSCWAFGGLLGLVAATLTAYPRSGLVAAGVSLAASVALLWSHSLLGRLG